MESLPPLTPEVPTPPSPESGRPEESLFPVPEPAPPALPPLPPRPPAPPTVPELPSIPSPIGPEPELSAPPLSQQEVESSQKLPLTAELRWLGEWWSRHLQKLPGVPAGRKGGTELVLLEILVPRDSEIKANAADQFFASIAGLKSKTGLSFEIVADHEHIHFIAAVPREFQPLVEKQLHAAYATAEIREIPDYDIFQREGYVAFDQLVTTGPKYYPIKTYTDLGEEADSLNSITSALTKLAPGEAAVIQFAISPAGASP